MFLHEGLPYKTITAHAALLEYFYYTQSLALPAMPDNDPSQLEQLSKDLMQWARAEGFRDIAITDADPGKHAQHLTNWLAEGFHGEMDYMEKHQHLRADPGELVPGATRVITLTMDYLPDTDAIRLLDEPDKAYIARYTLGRDYHKLIRKRLARLAKKLEQAAGGEYRAFVDSAPVLERGFAEKAGLGWIGKNTMLISREAGSWFFIGEILTDLPLPVAAPEYKEHCGTCSACLDICPTNAFTGPYQLDARRCISYLTIELRGSIDESLRPLMGNRIFGCDDCQLVCPWNRFATQTSEEAFMPREDLDDITLLELFSWSEDEFLKRTEGSAIRRTGYEGWLRNIAIALGNAPRSEQIIAALKAKTPHPSSLVQEHVSWALDAQHAKS